jgi:hypothetical protein
MRMIARAGDSIAASLSKEPRLWFFLFAIAYLTITMGLATRPFWYDELITWHVAQLPDMEAISAAIRDSADLNPPLLYWATRPVLALLGGGEVALRLPAIVGFLIMCWSACRFVRRRFPLPYAAVALLIPLITAAYRYAAEARPYGLELACIGLALVAWQEAGKPKRRPWSLLWFYLAMAGALLSHCYAVLALVPIGVAELVRQRSARRIDWPVWLCFIALAPCFLTYAPALAAFKLVKTTHAIFGPTFLSVPGFYGWLVGASVVPLAAGLLLAQGLPRAANDETRDAPAHEWIAALGLTLVPLLTFGLSLRAGSFFERYALTSVIGLAILVAFVAARAGAGSLRGGGAFVGVLLVWILLSCAANFAALWEPAVERPPVLSKIRPDLPIVISDPLMFLEAEHYQPADLLPRLHYLTDPSLGLAFTGSDNFDVSYRAFTKWFHLKAAVDPYAEFTRRYPTFLLYGNPRDPEDWLVRELRKEGASMTYLAQHPGRFYESVLLEVTQRSAEKIDTAMIRAQP